MKRQTTHSVFRIIISYLLLGGLWIAASDYVLKLFVTNTQKRAMLHDYEGWLFVAVSALFLSLFMKREFKFREQTETARRVSEEKYRLLLLGANDGIIIADAETGAILEINRKMEDLVGLPAETIIGMNMAELYPQNKRARCQEIFQDVIRNEKALANDLCIAHQGGRNIPVEISASIVELGGKKLLQGIFRDISRRQEAEEAQRKETVRAKQYLDVAGVMIVVIDRQGIVTLINRKGSEILGYAEEEIIGKNWFDAFIPSRIRNEVRTTFTQRISGARVAEEYYEIPIVNRNNEERMIAWHNIFLKNDLGQVVAALSSGEDIVVRKTAEEQARYRLEHLTTLHAIDMIINASLDLRVTLEKFLDLVISQLHVDAADVLLLNPHTQMLEYAALQGFRDTRILHARLRLGQGIAGRAALERRSISIPNLLDPNSGYERAPFLKGEGYLAYYVVPLISKGQIKGVLEIFHRSPLTFDEEWMSFLHALAAHAAIAIDNAALFSDLQRSNTDLILAYDTSIEGWARTLELRDKETEGHTKRAAEMTLHIARAMNMSDAELVHVRRGALLHDIGKMSIPDTVLLKAGPLTTEEWEIMRRHPVYAYELLSPIAYLRQALDIPYCHHERWDGTGYPRGLKGEQIPLAARIFALADTWDALISERRYHSAWSEERVLEHIRSLVGSQFDPNVVEVFLSMELKDRFEDFGAAAE
jgi:PAS domain S-box-containing protein/putative nucleotidyltransferase with HDIG domain